MKVNVTTRNPDGSIQFDGSLNRAEVTTLLQYAVNNLIAMGFILGQDEQPEEGDAPSRIVTPSGKTIQ